jgi:hypothetical protein
MSRTGTQLVAPNTSCPAGAAACPKLPHSFPEATLQLTCTMSWCIAWCMNALLSPPPPPGPPPAAAAAAGAAAGAAASETAGASPPLRVLAPLEAAGASAAAVGASAGGPPSSSSAPAVASSSGWAASAVYCSSPAAARHGARFMRCREHGMLPGREQRLSHQVTRTHPATPGPAVIITAKEASTPSHSRLTILPTGRHSASPFPSSLQRCSPATRCPALPISGQHSFDNPSSFHPPAQG